MSKTAVAQKTDTTRFLSPSQGVLQRKCACGNQTAGGGKCAECGKKQHRLQRKLSIGASNDPLEREADRVADQVMAAPINSSASGASLRIQRYAGQTEGAGTAPASVERVLSSSGRPLDTALRHDMEQRFGHDFSQVRVHSGAAAEQSAQDVSANAYTAGNDIVFGAGRLAPRTHEGRRLIAHELTHVVQQGACANQVTRSIQRAETDTVPGCASLIDTEQDVNTRVNASLAAARVGAGTPPAGGVVAQGVEHDLGRNVQTGRSAIEVWASTLPSTKASLPTQSATKYSGVGFRLWAQPLFPILNPTMKVNGICIGSDKLGHFFQQGATYLRTEAASGRAAAEEESERSEGGGFGLVSTGVFSNADQEANRQGGKFYRDLIVGPTMTFSISRYISSQWSEVTNPNFYESSVGHQVWANVLTGNWAGTSGISLTLRATASGSVTGTLSFGIGSTGRISNGVISYNTTRVRGTSMLGTNTSSTPISGIRFEFDWTLGADSGKGYLESIDEQHLTGRWGQGSSRTNKGAWDINRT